MILLGFGLFFPSWAGEAQAAPGSIDLIDVEGVIDPVSSRYLVRELQAAEKRQSRLVIVRLDTPGGLDTSMRQMVRKILSSPVPVAVWVAPDGARAASAGLFITYAAHVAAMAPATNIGAAHPVSLGGGQQDRAVSDKVTNDAVAYLKSIARQRGRNAEWAEKAIRKSESLSAAEAVEQNAVDFIAPTRGSLLRKLDGMRVTAAGRAVTIDTRGAPVIVREMGLFERVLHTAVNPEIAYMLLLLGFYGILFELYSPGLGLGGVLGASSMVLGLYALSVLPFTWAGAALLVLAMAFFIAEAVAPGIGVLSAGGVVSLVAGSLLLFAGAGPGFRLSIFAIVAGVGLTVLLFGFVTGAAVKARLARPISGSEGMVGQTGTARSDVAADGRVMAKGAIWKARSNAGVIARGSKVRVLAQDGMSLVVEPADESKPAPG